MSSVVDIANHNSTLIEFSLDLAVGNFSLISQAKTVD